MGKENSRLFVNNVPVENNTGTWVLRPGVDPYYAGFEFKASDASFYKTGNKIKFIHIEYDNKNNKVEKSVTIKNIVRQNIMPEEYGWTSAEAPPKYRRTSRIVNFGDIRHLLKFGGYALQANIRGQLYSELSGTELQNYARLIDQGGGANIPEQRQEIQNFKLRAYKQEYQDSFYRPETLNGDSPWTLKDVIEDIMSNAASGISQMFGVNLQYSVDIPDDEDIEVENLVIPGGTFANALKAVFALPEAANLVFVCDIDGGLAVTTRRRTRQFDIDKNIVDVITGDYGKIDMSTSRPKKVYAAFPVEYSVITNAVEWVLPVDITFTDNENKKHIAGEWMPADELLEHWGTSLEEAYKDALNNANGSFGLYLDNPSKYTSATSQVERDIWANRRLIADTYLFRAFRIYGQLPLPVNLDRPMYLTTDYYRQKQPYDNSYMVNVQCARILGQLQCVDPDQGVFVVQLGQFSHPDVRYGLQLALENVTSPKTTVLEKRTRLENTTRIHYYAKPLMTTIDEFYTEELHNFDDGFQKSHLYYFSNRSVIVDLTRLTSTSPDYWDYDVSRVNKKQRDIIKKVKNTLKRKSKIDLGDKKTGEYECLGFYTPGRFGDGAGLPGKLLPQDWTTVESVQYSLNGGIGKTNVRFFRSPFASGQDYGAFQIRRLEDRMRTIYGKVEI